MGVPAGMLPHQAGKAPNGFILFYQGFTVVVRTSQGHLCLFLLGFIFIIQFYWLIKIQFYQSVQMWSFGFFGSEVQQIQDMPHANRAFITNETSVITN